MVDINIDIRGKDERENLAVANKLSEYLVKLQYTIKQDIYQARNPQTGTCHTYMVFQPKEY